MKIVAISGSRTITDRIWINARLEEELNSIGEPVFLILGDAPGVDTIAKEFAINSQIPFLVLKPANKYYPSLYNELGFKGKLLYIARDYQMVDCADMLIALWDGSSKGTSITIEIAKEYGKAVTTIIYPYNR